MTDTHPRFDQRISLGGSALLRPRRLWPARARGAFDDLLRELDMWTRTHGCSSAGNTWIAEEAVREAWGETRWRPLTPPLRPREPEIDALPPALRRWPAAWRYQVAALERGGLPRAAAIDQARSELHASRGDTVPLCA